MIVGTRQGTDSSRIVGQDVDERYYRELIERGNVTTLAKNFGMMMKSGFSWITRSIGSSR